MLDAGSLRAVIIHATSVAIAQWEPANTFHTDVRSTLLIFVAGRANGPELLAQMVDAVFRFTFSTGFARLAVGFESFADAIEAAV